MDIKKNITNAKNMYLFSCLERHGITGPSKVMWSKDDEIRDLLKAFGNKLQHTWDE